MLRNQKGITLVALVITIIVLLILAGVTLAMISGQDGILTKAVSAKKQNELGAAKDEVALKVNTLIADFYEDRYVTGDYDKDVVGKYVIDNFGASMTTSNQVSVINSEGSLTLSYDGATATGEINATTGVLSWD